MHCALGHRQTLPDLRRAKNWKPHTIYNPPDTISITGQGFPPIASCPLALFFPAPNDLVNLHAYVIVAVRL
jgi:hypothetical protein